MHFKNKTVVVTGAAKGIGRHTALQFGELGAQVALLDVDQSQGRDLEKALSGKAKFVYCNVAEEESVKNAFKEIQAWSDQIDVLINNAGIQGAYRKVHETTLAEWNHILGINLSGQFLCAKYALLKMLTQPQGVIVNVASAQSFMSQRRVAAYTTSKTALLGLTRSIAVDYAPHIRCNAVAPGAVNTPMLAESIQQSADPEALWKECEEMHLLGKVASPDEIASVILFLSSEAASNITGQTFRVDGGLGVMIPGSKQD